jgi:hypothetical protein
MQAEKVELLQKINTLKTENETTKKDFQQMKIEMENQKVFFLE